MRKIDKAGFKPKYECYTNNSLSGTHKAGDVKAVIHVRLLHQKALRGEIIRSSDFKTELYSGLIREKLQICHHYKCCYCETIDEGDIEHFRPKSEVKQNKSSPTIRPAYYWLAYNWDNLLYACTSCNQRHKDTLFPLKDPSKRATPLNRSIRHEEPLLINPAKEAPEQHLSFREDGYPIALDTKGQASIECYGLYRSTLITRRREIFEIVEKRFNEYLLSKTASGIDTNTARKAFLEEYENRTQVNKSFSNCVKMVFGKKYEWVITGRI